MNWLPLAVAGEFAAAYAVTVVEVAPDYGRCPCSGVYERRVVEVNMTVDGEQILLEGVPQGACPLCGSRVYKQVVLNAIETVMRGG
jgi:YgiT-type zinc finger domain-containing protein